MNQAPQNRDLLDRLAAEYVLGTLRGQARQRFERWRLSSPLVDDRCRFWEEQLVSLLAEMRTLEPPPDAWERIRARLKLPGSSPQALSRPRVWAVAVSIVLVVGFGALWYWRTSQFGRATEVATFATPSGTSLWQVEFYSRPHSVARVQVSAGPMTRPPAGHDYELWALPKGGAPVSLGVLPYEANAIRRSLTAGQRIALASASQLAVSIEPLGGSLTGLPTGAVIYVVPLRAVSS